MVVHVVGDRQVATQLGGSPAMWRRLNELIGRPELRDDPCFASPTVRRDNWPALLEILGEWIGQFESVDKAVETLAVARIPGVAMLRTEEVIAHPHLAHRGAFPAVPHPVQGTTRVTATPFHLDGKVIFPTGPMPYRIGQHTREVVIDWLGYSQERLQALAVQQVVEVG